MKRRLRTPSPSMIVALIALCVALGGSAYAASQINGKNIKNGTITGKKLHSRTITSRQIARSTVRALKNRRGLRGPRGYKGPKGDKGADGTAVAYARLAADGTIDTTRVKGITQANISHPSAGIYCVSLSFAARNVLATLEPTATGNELVYASIPAPTPSLGCPAGAVTVQVRHSGGAAVDAPLYVAFN